MSRPLGNSLSFSLLYSHPLSLFSCKSNLTQPINLVVLIEHVRSNKEYVFEYGPSSLCTRASFIDLQTLQQCGEVRLPANTTEAEAVVENWKVALEDAIDRKRPLSRAEKQILDLHIDILDNYMPAFEIPLSIANDKFDKFSNLYKQLLKSIPPSSDFSRSDIGNLFCHHQPSLALMQISRLAPSVSPYYSAMK
ncbi:uncharacterized protein LAESUDRAFT_715812 [Laetiporus sulphureus 93-53]|uniref:Uncharacterized protein n=1 Tax=Laetiporus sulphureus 93-53 TaxID=1314785 RepID=A0A165D3U2_9APHY|nr:uncharacterized protein LAESUDRAFT_715812 [Laetiporus sulphureus 93-53]KZT04102.1 hypothetical protein LAESUDRAFT_715812 [Laetiporus sulphureus 93-53]